MKCNHNRNRLGYIVNLIVIDDYFR